VELSKTAIDPERTDIIESFLEKQALKLIKKTNLRQKPDYFKVPLIRLKIEYTGYDILRGHNVVKKLIGKVANPNYILQWYK